MFDFVGFFVKLFDCVSEGLECGIPIVGFGDSVDCSR